MKNHGPTWPWFFTLAEGGTYLDLDDPALRRLAAGDPQAFVRNLSEPVVLDEFQRQPDLLSSIKPS